MTSPRGLGGRRRDVIVVRHGERIDETREGKSWARSTPRQFLFDPPLTEKGAAQARAAGTVLVELDSRKFSRIYTSPLSRTLSTSEEIANMLNCPVSVVPGLGSCAKQVVKDGGVTKVPLVKPDTICSRVDRVERDAPVGFKEACNWIVQNHDSDTTPLIITHREGIRKLADDHYRLPYCVIAHFNAPNDEDGGEWSLRSLVDPKDRDEVEFDFDLPQMPNFDDDT